jgi:ankyrin repeat protein
MFYNVFDISSSKFTALHAAALYLEYNVVSNVASSILRAILGKYSEPHHLNYQITEGYQKGQTPLHLAVETGNASAVRMLLEEGEEDLDLTLLNTKQESVVDVALLGLKNQKDTIESWEVPLEEQEEADQRHWRHALEILFNLQEYGAKYHKYECAVCHPEPNDLFIFNMGEGAPIVKIDISGNFALFYSAGCKKYTNLIFLLNVIDLSMSLPEELLENHPFWSRVAKLNVGSAFWIVDPLSISTSELDMSTTALMGNNILSLANSELPHESELAHFSNNQGVV